MLLKSASIKTMFNNNATREKMSPMLMILLSAMSFIFLNIISAQQFRKYSYNNLANS